MLGHKRGDGGDTLDVTFPPAEIQIRAYAPGVVFTRVRGDLTRCQRLSWAVLGALATLVVRSWKKLRKEQSAQLRKAERGGGKAPLLASCCALKVRYHK
jgi:hypothetical protein